MKTLIFILSFFLFSGITFSQGWPGHMERINEFSPTPYKKVDAIVGASIILGTFSINEFNGPNMTQNQIRNTFLAGVGLSVGYNLFKMSKPYKRMEEKVKHKIQLKHNKRLR